MKKHGYNAKSYFKLMLNKLKIMKGPLISYIPFGDLGQGSFPEQFHMLIIQIIFLKLFKTINKWMMYEIHLSNENLSIMDGHG
jgi:hypothetical protein